ncbi:contractile injection system tape measure protein [Desulfobacula phenolica]|uniref:Uncharacterized protein n=1 Tax=Desulfobacula phenolica TaxID=90732 RepID=A0A1H2JPB3_9BACT|nr:contractile injection system tape measure protein [Desulfobacula phenolica]SDU58374.1 hypothetical protein SAMN04487931_11422 [Desulfobacula phenolica]
MNTRHRIHHMTADIHFERPMDALLHQQNLHGFIQHDLARVMEEVFDEISPGNDHIRIRKLLVDLGKINCRNFEQEMASKLRSCLWDALRREIQSVKTARPSSFDFMAAKLIEIIRTGSHQDMDPYWIPLIATHGRRTRELLLKQGKNPFVRKHIAWLFPKERLRELILLFEPFNHGFIDYFLDRPERLLTWETMRTANPGNFKKQVAEFILAYLFIEKGSRFNKKFFLSSVIRQISGHYNIRTSDFLFSLIHVFETVKDQSPLRKEILAFLLELEQETKDPERQKDPVDQREKNLVFNYLLDKTGRVEKESSQIIERLIMTDPKSIAGFLDQHRNFPGPVKKLVRILSPPMLGSLLNIRHPGRHAVMTKYTGILNQAYYSRLFSGSEKTAHFLLWEAILRFEPPFEEQKFCRHLLLEVSANSKISGQRERFFNQLIIRLVLDLRKNREHYYLLKAVLELKGIKAGLELLGEKGFENLDNAVSFLRFYLKKAGRRKQIAASFSQTRITSMIRLIQPFQYEFIDAAIKESCLFLKQTTALDQGETAFKRLLHEFVLDFLVHEKTGGFNKKNFMAGIIRQLARHTGIKYKKQVDLFKAFVEKSPAQNPVKHQLGNVILALETDLIFDGKTRDEKESAQVLVMSFLTQILPAKGNETSYLINAVKKFETKAKNKTAYYSAILEKLLQNNTIDFDRILDEKTPEPPGDKTSSRNRIFQEKISGLLTANPVLLHGFIEKHLHRLEFIVLLMTSLRPALLNRILYLLRPRDFVLITRYTNILKKSIGSACGLSDGQEMETNAWQAIFMSIREKNLLHCFDETVFIHSFLKHMAKKIPKYSTKAFYDRIEKNLSQRRFPPSAKKEYIEAIKVVSSLGKALDQIKTPRLPQKSPLLRPKSLQMPKPENREDVMETLYPGNCGLVIAAPYLPQLFKSLGLMENLRFKNSQAARRGVRLLQYMTDRTTDTPWQLLALNRILCNAPPKTPKDEPFQIMPHEQEIIESLISGMIQNWKAIGNTSIPGFRESFLTRNGVLTLDRNDCWRLKVESKTFDMLLDSLPWSFSTIRHPWMDRVIYVKWR